VSHLSAESLGSEKGGYKIRQRAGVFPGFAGDNALKRGIFP
jgi:hypothetical protein